MPTARAATEVGQCCSCELVGMFPEFGFVIIPPICTYCLLLCYSCNSIAESDQIFPDHVTDDQLDGKHDCDKCVVQRVDGVVRAYYTRCLSNNVRQTRLGSRDYEPKSLRDTPSFHVPTADILLCATAPASNIRRQTTLRAGHPLKKLR